ncbi:MAG: recombinase [Burkholderiales bacterium PBB6]|nr:MAG: recombinase [Burkholderiales bacterium PBB6]
MAAADRWDLTSLLNAADPAAPAVERHLWLIRLLEWLREPGPQSPFTDGDLPDESASTPWPVRRLKHLLNVLDRHPEHHQSIGDLLRTSLAGLDATGLLADFGFAPRQGFVSELADRVRLSCLPGTPQTRDLGELFRLLFNGEDDTTWLQAIDDATLLRFMALCQGDTGDTAWRAAVIESIQLLASQMRAAGLAGPMRQRMDLSLMATRPFHQLVPAAEALRDELHEGTDALTRQQQAHYLRAVLATCREAAASVRQHLDEHGISVDVVFQVDQLQARGDRIEALLDCLLAPAPAAAPELRHLLVALVEAGQGRRGIRRLFAQHYGLLARKVTERSAETGEHYITRDRAEYRQMLVQAAGGGAIIGLTTVAKFLLALISLSVFWAGFWAGMNYAISFVVVQLLHWTVATKQPAMTAPAIAAKLENVSANDAALEDFVDEVAHLFRSQVAGIIGNLALVVPVVLLIQGAAWALAGAPVIGAEQAKYVLHSLHLAGPTVFFAAFTGILLFGSSLIAGWVENWFVFHRLDSAIAWNPRFIQVLGATRAQSWARWWRQNISGLAANVSLGLMLGIVPAIGTFFGLPLEVRHVTLSMGQLAAALGALGTDLLREPDFWWCLAAIPMIGVLNLGVSFTLAFRVALASRGLKLRDRGRVYAALRARLRSRPGSFLVPPPDQPAR